MLSNKSIPSTYITRTFTRNIAPAEHIQAVKFTRLYIISTLRLRSIIKFVQLNALRKQ